MRLRRQTPPPAPVPPNPGAFAARQQGCTCCAVSNQWGRGITDPLGDHPYYVIAPDCPLHAGPSRAA